MPKKPAANNTSARKHTVKDISFNGSDFRIIEYPDFIEENNKKIRVKGLGEKSASINSFFLDYLKEYHIPVAFVKSDSAASLRFLKYSEFPFYVRINNVADKRTAKIFNIKELELLSLPLFEYHYGSSKDTLITESHLISFDLCSYEDLKLINRISSKVNAVLRSFFERRLEILAEVNCYFGKAEDKIYIVADFTPGSLKIIPNEINNKFINPYWISTPAQLRNYVNHILKLMSS